MTTPPNTIGYGAIVMPSIDLYEGFFIVDIPLFQRIANVISSAAIQAGALPSPALQAALQAAFAEGVLHQKKELIGGALLALAKHTESNYFVVFANKVASGFSTEIRPLPASSPDEARAALDALPEVIHIKANITAKYAPGGRAVPPTKRS